MAKPGCLPRCGTGFRVMYSASCGRNNARALVAHSKKPPGKPQALALFSPHPADSLEAREFLPRTGWQDGSGPLLHISHASAFILSTVAALRLAIWARMGFHSTSVKSAMIAEMLPAILPASLMVSGPITSCRSPRSLHLRRLRACRHAPPEWREAHPCPPRSRGHRCPDPAPRAWARGS